ncbi:hypothetical protein CYQ88_01550 [Hydrogenovibrio sp. SC-1]|uniref:thioredoxin family protein n=1 Tax=Hydrogenovibrio sp. SC-1 TaxID=2065820 RepID=UPI000C7A6818|nr:thioredoxin fold domain-containing protein [Hydrogenovibrio sp. SC-1]PLA75278.1 hypothetical protein CYQ88_01550 [Hydrogenovibrio sp. SC-1]
MRFYLSIFLLALFALTACDQPAKANSNAYPTSNLKELTNLEQLAKQARQHNLPILLSVGAQWCEFCHQLRDEVLSPMALGGDYEGHYMFMRYLSIDDHQPIAGVNGKPIIKHRLAESYGADLTPTVIFIDGHGKEVADKIVGIANIELFSALIHNRLNQAYKNMGNALRINVMPGQDLSH